MTRPFESLDMQSEAALYTVLNVTDDLTHCGHMGHIVNDFHRMCAIAAESGFDAVNIDFLADAQISLGDRKALLENYGLRPAAFGLPVPIYSEHDEAAFKAGLRSFEQQARWAGLLGCNIVNAYLPPYSHTSCFNENFQLLARRLAMLRPVLDAHDLRLALEFIGPTETRMHARYDFIHTIDGVRCLIAAAGLYGRAGFKLDVHHWQYSGASLLDLRHLDEEYFLYVELNDALEGYDMFSMPEFQRALPLQTGVTDIAGFMQVLREKHYAGPIAVEPWSDAIRKMPLDEAVRLAKDALDRSLALPGSSQAAILPRTCAYSAAGNAHDRH